MYSIASWSPSQSAPFRVIKMPAPVVVAHVSERRGNADLVATVWLRVGKTLVIQAVRRPSKPCRTSPAARCRRRRELRRHKCDLIWYALVFMAFLCAILNPAALSAEGRRWKK